MAEISEEKLKTYREKTFRFAAGTQLRTIDEAVDYIDERGFVFFWPIKNTEYPSLWNAVAGNRPVPDEHDDPGHATWDWKDKLLGQRRVYYGRVLKGRNAFISLAVLPCFYALSPNYGEPEMDYLEEYEQGLMAAETKAVFEALIKEGAMDTISLRKISRMTGPGSDSRFNRALNKLQEDFRILPVGISPAGAWKYAFIYDLTHRHFPDLIEDARSVSEYQARERLLLHYFQSVGAAKKESARRLLNWQTRDNDHTLQKLVNSGELVDNVTRKNQGDGWISLPELV